MTAQNNSSATLKTAKGEHERALFEAVASDHGLWPKAIERDAKGNYLLLTTANGWMWWQHARSMPAAAPQAVAPQAPAAVPDWEEAARTMSVKIAQNCNSVPQLVFPFLYLGLKDLFATPGLPATEDSSAGEQAEATARQAAPDGWRLVPVDATRSMINAAAAVEEDGYDAMHKAMLSAAPPSPDREPLTDDLIWAMEQLMKWQVKNVKKWHNHAYDNAHHVLEKFKAAHGIEATVENLQASLGATK